MVKIPKLETRFRCEDCGNVYLTLAECTVHVHMRHRTGEDNYMAVFPVIEENAHLLYSDVCGCGVEVKEENGMRLFVHNEVRN